jgi:hypothetical protein
VAGLTAVQAVQEPAVPQMSRDAASDGQGPEVHVRAYLLHQVLLLLRNAVKVFAKMYVSNHKIIICDISI